MCPGWRRSRTGWRRRWEDCRMNAKRWRTSSGCTGWSAPSCARPRHTDLPLTTNHVFGSREESARAGINFVWCSLFSKTTRRRGLSCLQKELLLMLGMRSSRGLTVDSKAGVDGRTVSTGSGGLEGCDKASAGKSTNICWNPSDKKQFYGDWEALDLNAMF